MSLEITLSDGTTTIALPSDLQWQDEFAWDSVEQEGEYSLTGNYVVQEGVKQSGRPITLFGGRSASWITRSQLQALKLIAEVPDQTLTLVLWGNSYTVAFRRPALSAEPILRQADPGADHFYAITINLMEVPA